MSLGGFNGTDPAITLAQFKALVHAGEVHYFVAGSQGFIGSTAANTSTAYAIEQWVTSTERAAHPRLLRVDVGIGRAQLASTSAR